MRKLTKQELRRQAQLEKQLASEGLAPIGTPKFGTLPGISPHNTKARGVGFTSLETHDGDGHFDATSMFELDSMRDFGTTSTPGPSDTPTGSYFRVFGQHVEASHAHSKDYAFLRAYADCGYVALACHRAGWKWKGPATLHRAARVLRYFCALHSLPFNPFASHRAGAPSRQDPLRCYECPPGPLGVHSKHGPVKAPILDARPNRHPPATPDRPPVRDRLDAPHPGQVKRVRKRPAT
jgi:hypothetical protein